MYITGSALALHFKQGPGELLLQQLGAVTLILTLPLCEIHGHSKNVVVKFCRNALQLTHAQLLPKLKVWMHCYEIGKEQDCTHIGLRAVGQLGMNSHRLSLGIRHDLPLQLYLLYVSLSSNCVCVFRFGILGRGERICSRRLNYIFKKARTLYYIYQSNEYSRRD